MSNPMCIEAARVTEAVHLHTLCRHEFSAAGMGSNFYAHANADIREPALREGGFWLSESEEM